MLGTHNVGALFIDLTKGLQAATEGPYSVRTRAAGDGSTTACGGWSIFAAKKFEALVRAP
jgi:hypothetical protein